MVNCQRYPDGCPDQHSWDNLYHFVEFGLVPDPLPCQPQHSATIYYNYDDYVLVGNTLTKEQVRRRPVVDFPALERGANYTAILIDADATSGDGNSKSPYLLFLAVNSYEVIINSSDMVAPYQSPNPKPGTDVHRYIWLLYKQQERIDPKRAAYYDQNRRDFSLKDFAAENNLTVPTAGNMFMTSA